MKKALILILAMLMIVSLIGCSSQTAASPDPVQEPAVEETTENKYIDGTYEAVSDAGERGYGKVIVTIANDEIVDLELVEFTGFNEEKAEDYAYETFHQAKEALQEAFLAANGTEGVDAFTGATSSSTKWTQALDRALEKL